MTASAKIKNYHYASSDDGAFAVEVDQPCEGVVTLTWKPQDYPGKGSEIQMPHAIFLSVARAYLAERKAAVTAP